MHFILQKKNYKFAFFGSFNIRLLFFDSLIYFGKLQSAVDSVITY